MAIVEGNIPHDAADAGNPLKIGGKAVTGAPSAVVDGDRVDVHFDELGKMAVMIGGDGDTNMARTSAGQGDETSNSLGSLFVTSYSMGFAPDNLWDRLRTLGNTAGSGLGILAVGTKTPGAGDVQAIIRQTVADSTTRVTVITPGSGLRVRILGVFCSNASATGVRIGVYFGTGATAITTAGNIIANPFCDLTDAPNSAFPNYSTDEAGPIGAADAVVSLVTTGDIGTSGQAIVIWREE